MPCVSVARPVLAGEITLRTSGTRALVIKFPGPGILISFVYSQSIGFSDCAKIARRATDFKVPDLYASIFSSVYNIAAAALRKASRPRARSREWNAIFMFIRADGNSHFYGIVCFRSSRFRHSVVPGILKGLLSAKWNVSRCFVVVAKGKKCRLIM